VLRDTPGGFIRDDYDPQKLFYQGAFRLVACRAPGDGQSQTPPSDEQRVVWRTFLNNRAHIIDDIVDGARAAYVRQRPARLFWWTEMYGGDDPLLPEALPEIPTASELRKLVRPHRFVDPQHTADVTLDAILRYYRQVFDIYHQGYEDAEEANRLMPPIDSRDSLRDLIIFQTMRISAQDDRAANRRSLGSASRAQGTMSTVCRSGGATARSRKWAASKRSCNLACPGK
jgi:hypothetical protein